MRDARFGQGVMAACVLMRDAQGAIECCLCTSVLDAMTLGIEQLQKDPTFTAVVIAGEHDSADEIRYVLSSRAKAIAERLAHPGLFLTLAAQDIVRDKLRMDARFEDFGIIDTDEFGRAERVYAVVHPDLPEPVLPHKPVSGNCPRLHRSFIGRHRETDELQNLILQRSLVTLIGPPGVGKTATAIHVGRSFGDEYEDGTWWFSVEDRASVDELIHAISRERGFLSLRGPVDATRLAEALAPKKAILILDGCDRMIADVGPLCRAIVERATSLTLLLTSTKPLGIPEEYIFRIEPLSLPERGDVGRDALFVSEALALFFDRAEQAGLRFALDDRTVSLATDLCERVDGLPMAIELVAASLRTSSLELVNQELSSDLVPLSARSLGSVQHRPIEDALRLSYRTLSPDMSRLASRLALFRGEWTIDDARELWGRDFDPSELGSLHHDLADSSWIAFNPDRNAYHMLHTLRSFAWESAGHHRDELLQAFCAGIARMAGQIYGTSGTGHAESDLTLSRHYSDLMFAVEAAIAEWPVIASSLMQYMVQLWLQRNLLDDAYKVSQKYASGAQGIDKARALVMIGVVHLRRRQLASAVSAFQQCLVLARQAGNSVAESAALTNLGLATQDQGNYVKALEYYAEAAKILRQASHSNNLCAALCNASDAEVRLTFTLVDPAEREIHLMNAERHLAEAMTLSPNVDPLRLQALWHASGVLAFARGRNEEAEADLMRAIGVCARHGLRHEAGEAAEVLAEISLSKGLAPTAAKLLGLSRQIRRESGKTRTESEMQYFGKLVGRLHEQIDRDRAEKLMRYGERLDLAEISTATVSGS